MNYTGAGYVYAITNTNNGNAYIGSTISPHKRWGAHRRLLRAGKHHSFILQAAWDKHKEAAFKFSVLLVCPQELRTFYEEAIMPLASYNLVRTKLQKIFSGAKISAALIGRPKTTTHRAAISAGKTGMKMGSAFCEKARLRQLGKPMTVEARRKLSDKIKSVRADEATQTRERVYEVYNKFVYGGPSVSALCADVGLGVSHFYMVCVAENLPSIKTVAVERFLAKIAAMTAEGYSMQAASDALGVKSQTIRALLRKRRKASNG
jgi:hypothetical protein